MSVHSQESHTSKTANSRHKMKTISSAFFSLDSVWLANLIKTRRGEVRVGNVVNVGYVSDDQMAWNVVKGANRSFWNSVYIWFYIWFSVTTGVRLMFLKSTAFRDRSVKKDPNETLWNFWFPLLSIFWEAFSG